MFGKESLAVDLASPLFLKNTAYGLGTGAGGLIGNKLGLMENRRESEFGDPPIEKSHGIADEVKYTTCYMCACRCGIRVNLKGGRIRYIEGNRRHPVNRGVLCAKGAAGLMQHYSPARLRNPLVRTGPRGSGQFRE